jgi:DNA-binding NarL/FixJ family response regulator
MRSYLLLRDSKESGPFSFDELKRDGILSSDLVWIAGKSSAWRYADEIKELQPFVRHASVINNNTPDINSPEDQHREYSARGFDNAPGNGSLTVEKRKDSDEYYDEGLSDPPPVQIFAGKNPENHPDGTPLTEIIRVIIADDHSLFREGVKMALSYKNDIKIVGEAENGMQLLNLLKHNLPDVILLDIQMPVMDGISALTSIRKNYGDVKVIMLSMYNDHSMVSTLMEKGANAYLTKSADAESIYEAIKTCFSKSYYFNDLTNMSMLEKIRSKKNTIKPVEYRNESLNQVFKIPDIPIRQDLTASRKISKQLLIVTCSILVISSGIMTGISILNSTQKSAHPQNSSQSPAQSASADPPELKRVATTAKTTDNSLQIKTNQVLNGRIYPATKNGVDENQKLNNKATSKLASGFNSENSPKLFSSVKNASSEAGVKKAMTRKKIRSLVTVHSDNSNIETNNTSFFIGLTVYNQTIYKLDLVTVEVKYLLSDSSVYKSEIIYFKGIAPLSSKLMEAPKSLMEARLECKIISIKSRELEL